MSCALLQDSLSFCEVALGSAHLVRRSACRTRALVLLFVLLQQTHVAGFEIFAEQQRIEVSSNGETWDTRGTGINVEDSWVQMDVDNSPLQGWLLEKHVRLGCFEVDFANESLYIERPIASEETLISDIMCVSFCDRMQAYHRPGDGVVSAGECRCARQYGSEPTLTADGGAVCSGDVWDVFREYDFRASMSPSIFDVTRRHLYSLVTVSLPELGFVSYLHAVDAMEALPQFQFDRRLDRMLFNIVWDFSASRLVGLSINNFNENGPNRMLDLTVMHFNTTGGTLRVTTTTSPVQDEIEAMAGADLGDFMSEGFVGIEGLAAIDVITGTYFTVVPGGKIRGDYYHVLVAVDIASASVVYSGRLLHQSTPMVLMNMQANSLSHMLYGAGSTTSASADLALSYYRLCNSSNATPVSVVCEPQDLGELPPEVEMMYLQSSAMDHRADYTWFTFKEEPEGAPRIIEYHIGEPQDPYLLWRNDSIPSDAVYVSVIQTAPRIIFSLHPPNIQEARFSSSGAMVTVVFDVPTLQGAEPIDNDNDGVPDDWNDEDMSIREGCESFFDENTMLLIPDALCEWISSTTLVIELTKQATLKPEMLILVRANRIYAGERQGGVVKLSQPSSGFARVQLPTIPLVPEATFSSYEVVDPCTDIFLDGGPSINHGFRGKFIWRLSGTDPTKDLPQLESIFQAARDAANDAAQQGLGTSESLTIPNGTVATTDLPILLTIALDVYSFFDQFFSEVLLGTFSKTVFISNVIVPTLRIFGPAQQTVLRSRGHAFSSALIINDCLLSLLGPAYSTQFVWYGCAEQDAVTVQGSARCTSWNETFFDLSRISGRSSRSISLDTYALKLDAVGAGPLLLTSAVTITRSDGEVFTNAQSIQLDIGLEPLEAAFVGGSVFQANFGEVIVVDAGATYDPVDQSTDGITFAIVCYKTGTTEPCISGSKNGTAELELNGCQLSASSFAYRNITYPEPDSAEARDCCAVTNTALYIAPDALPVGDYIFEVTASKAWYGGVRQGVATVQVEVRAQVTVPAIALSIPTESPLIAQAQIAIVGSSTSDYSNTWSAQLWYANGWTDAYMDFQDTTQVEASANSSQATLFVMPGVLTAGERYKFRLTSQAGSGTTFAEIAFDVLGVPPSGGSLVISPESGLALQDVFELKMDGWSSQDTPISYMFSYQVIPGSSDNRTLGTVYSARNTLQTKLPEGQSVELTYGLRVYGSARSALGAIRTVFKDITVMDIGTADSVSVALQELENIDLESMISFGTSVAKALGATNGSGSDPGVLADLQHVFELYLNQSSLGSGSTDLPKTAESIALQAGLIESLAEAGLLTSDALLACEKLEDLALQEGLVIATPAVGAFDAAGSVLNCADAFVPDSDQTSSDEDLTARRLAQLENEISSDRSRRLTSAGSGNASFDTRTKADRYDQLVRVLGLEQKVGGSLVRAMIEGQQPKRYDLQKHEIYFWKGATGSDDAQVTFDQPEFSLPSLSRPGQPTAAAVQFSVYKVWPYNFLSPEMPSLHALTADGLTDNSSSVPAQTYSQLGNVGNGRSLLWHAVSLRVTDTDGNPLDVNLTGVANATFAMLPRVKAHSTVLDSASLELWNQYSFSCFEINFGSDLATARYDDSWITMDNDECVSSHPTNYVILLDDLAEELGVVDQEGASLTAAFEDETATAAMVSSLVLMIVLTFVAAAVAVYFDHKQGDEFIDLNETYVVKDKEEWKEKFTATLLNTFKRVHLLVGLGHKHRKFTRPNRVFALFLLWISMETINTLFYALEGFPTSGGSFVATGLVSGVMVWPLMQLVIVLYEYCPETKVLTVAPPPAKQATPIPFNLQATLYSPERPLAAELTLEKVRPPPPGAPLRGLGRARVPQLSIMKFSPQFALELPAPKPGDKAPLPPKRGPKVPKPPSVPAPSRNLMLGDAQGALVPLAQLQGGPFGLTLPDLPPLSKGAVGVKVSPPRRPPGRGPKPPAAPPPKSKMFFTVPPLLDASAYHQLPSLRQLPSLKQHPYIQPPPTGAMLPPLPLPKATSSAGGGPTPVPPMPRPKPGTKPKPPALMPAAEAQMKASMRAPVAMKALPAPQGPPQGPPAAVRRLPLGTVPKPPPAGQASAMMKAAVRTPPAVVAPDLEVEEVGRSLPLPVTLQRDPKHGMAPGSRSTTPPKNGQSESLDMLSPLAATPTSPDAFRVSLPGSIPDSDSPFGADFSASDWQGSPTQVQLPTMPELPESISYKAAEEDDDYVTSPGGTRKQAWETSAPERGGDPPEQVALPLGLHPVSQSSLPPMPPLREVAPESTALVPTIAPHHHSLGKPPPPPPKNSSVRPKDLPEPGEDEPVRRLLPYKAGMPRLQPKPPVRKGNAPAGPVPPPGPPPAYAYMMSKKDGVPPGVDMQAVLSKAKAPRTSAKPPHVPPPSYLRPGRVQDPRDAQASGPAEVGTASETLRRKRKGSKKHGRHDKHVMVPDWLHTVMVRMIDAFVCACIVVCCIFSVAYGSHLESSVIFAVHAASIVGLLINLGLFESVKCLVVACIALMRHEMAEAQARKPASKAGGVSGAHENGQSR